MLMKDLIIYNLHKHSKFERNIEKFDIELGGKIQQNINTVLSFLLNASLQDKLYFLIHARFFRIAVFRLHDEFTFLKS